MKIIREKVDLPDAAEQPLVHPLDLADSRKPFIVSWWLSVPAMPTVVFLLVAVLWTVSNNYVTPIVIPVILAAVSGLLGRVMQREAWAYIPRRRQDTLRFSPAPWPWLTAAISTVSLLAALVLLALWVVGQGADTGIVGYILGTGAGIVVVMIAGMLWTAFTPVRLSASLGGWLTQSVRLIAVAGAVLVGYSIVDSRYDTTELATSDIVTGAAIIIAIQVLWWLIAFRRSLNESTQSNTTPA